MAKRKHSKVRTTFWMTFALALVIAGAFLLPTGCTLDTTPKILPHPPVAGRGEAK